VSTKRETGHSAVSLASALAVETIEIRLHRWETCAVMLFSESIVNVHMRVSASPLMAAVVNIHHSCSGKQQVVSVSGAAAAVANAVSSPASSLARPPAVRILHTAIKSIC
jgi:hypothetical protein